MSKRLKRLSALLMVILFVSALLPTTASAAGKIMADQPVSLTINYKDGSKAIPNARFSLFKVADVDEYACMTLTTEFEAYKNNISGLSNLESMDHDKWLDLASTLKGYVQQDELISAFSGKTDENGILSANVKPGLYLVIGYRTTTDDYYTYTATPYMIFLPGEDSQNNDWNYSVTTSPKFEKDYYPPDGPDPVITRKALKVWDDAGYESIRPKEIIVQLLCDGKIASKIADNTVTLSKANDWRYAWDNLDANHEWDVIEEDVDGYAVSITRSGITFIVTNSYEHENPPDDPTSPDPILPQTGLLWWPVPLLICVGLTFVMIGVIRCRRCN